MEKRTWLISCRRQRGLSQFEVSKLIDMSQQGYGAIENGKRRPSPDLAQKIGKVLNFDWTKFYKKEE